MGENRGIDRFWIKGKIALSRPRLRAPSPAKAALQQEPPADDRQNILRTGCREGRTVEENAATAFLNGLKNSTPQGFPTRTHSDEMRPLREFQRARRWMAARVWRFETSRPGTG